MFKNLGKLKYRVRDDISEIDCNNLRNGINNLDNFIIYKNKLQIDIYNRVCDHNGGRLISNKNRISCPMHNWEFFPDKGIYKNGYIKKKMNYVKKKNKLFIKNKIFEPKIKKLKNSDNITVEYINHACLIFKTKDFKFATDPWTIGPAFNTGWWLKHKTIREWKRELNSCNFIYVSHNHPDHLHELTLSNLRKDMPIIVPNFTSNSTKLLIEDLGFKNIIKLTFENQYKFENSNLVLSVLKSGDLREDSGLYFSLGDFTSLLTVDANNLNFLKLPKVVFLASSFAGGAHGYPLNCENYKLKDRIKMTNTEKNFQKITKTKYLNFIKPKYFLPYAGFFTEKLKRDSIYIKYNKKNKIKDYLSICNKRNIKLLNVEDKRKFTFKNLKLIKKEKCKGPFYNDLNEKAYLKYYIKKYNKIDYKYIKNYFKNSNFHDNSKLYISLTNDNFNVNEASFRIKFSEKIEFQILKNSKLLKELNNINNFLHLKIRKEAFLNTIYNKKSWEDISIGFQMIQFRRPNIYNSKFWFHFSNNYVSKKYVKSITDCSACNTIKQDLDNILYDRNIMQLNNFKLV